MTWIKEKDIYEVQFFPFLGDMEKWRVYVADNEKKAKKIFKSIVAQWTSKKTIVYDCLAIRSKEIEAIIVTKVDRKGLYAKP